MNDLKVPAAIAAPILAHAPDTGSVAPIAEKPAGTLEFDQQTGHLRGADESPTGETMLRGSGAKLTRVRSRRQAQGANTYQAIVIVEGWKINVDLMDDGEYDAYQANEKKISGLMRLLSTGSADIADRLYELQTAVADGIMLQKVKGFEEFAASADEKTDLFFPEKQRICDLIVQKSRLGRADTDFLARS